MYVEKPHWGIMWRERAWNVCNVFVCLVLTTNRSPVDDVLYFQSRASVLLESTGNCTTEPFFSKQIPDELINAAWKNFSPRYKNLTQKATSRDTRYVLGTLCYTKIDSRPDRMVRMRSFLTLYYRVTWYSIRLIGHCNLRRTHVHYGFPYLSIGKFDLRGEKQIPR